jgi:hypothetical protein
MEKNVEYAVSLINSEVQYGEGWFFLKSLHFIKKF